jgi:hypothetical protein
VLAVLAVVVELERVVIGQQRRIADEGVAEGPNSASSAEPAATS